MDYDPVPETDDSPRMSRITIMADDNQLLKDLTGRMDVLLLGTNVELRRQSLQSRCANIWEAIMRETQHFVARLAVSGTYDYRNAHWRQQQLNNTMKSNQFRNHKVPINRNGKRGAR